MAIRDRDTDPSTGQLFYVMERMTESLQDRLEGAGRLEVAEAMRWATGILLGIDHAARNGVFHRDLKPANILRDRLGLVVLCDYGIALLVGATPLTPHGHQVPGTPGYVAPEVLECGESSARSEVFAAGCVIYQMLAGQLPWPSRAREDAVEVMRNDDPPRLETLVPEIDEALADVVANSLAPDPLARYATAAEFLCALDEARLLAGEPGLMQGSVRDDAWAATSGDRARATSSPGDPDRNAIAAIGQPAVFMNSAHALTASPDAPVASSGRLAAFVARGTALFAVVAAFFALAVDLSDDPPPILARAPRTGAPLQRAPRNSAGAHAGEYNLLATTRARHIGHAPVSQPLATATRSDTANASATQPANCCASLDSKPRHSAQLPRYAGDNTGHTAESEPSESPESTQESSTTTEATSASSGGGAASAQGSASASSSTQISTSGSTTIVQGTQGQTISSTSGTVRQCAGGQEITSSSGTVVQGTGC
jgi:hypothetical protein